MASLEPNSTNNSSPSGNSNNEEVRLSQKSFEKECSSNAQPPMADNGHVDGWPCSKGAASVKWDRERFDIRRPYERKEYDRPHRALPNYLAAFEGLNVKPQKCCKPNAFARRTPIEEVFHERNRTKVCPTEAPRPLEDCVDDVIVAGNVSSKEEENEEDEEEEEEKNVHKRRISKECCKTFFQARRALLRSELFDRYFNRPPSPENESESEDAIGEFEQIVSENQQVEPQHHDLVDSSEQLEDSSCSISSYKSPEIVHKENKPAAIEAQEQFLDRMRNHYLARFDRVREQMEKVERDRHKQPEPFDGEKYMAEYPAPDIRNEGKVRLRETLERRLAELNKVQERPVRQYPTTVKQFAMYKERLMEDRRKLRDEAALVEDYFRKADAPREIPEAKLEVKRFRLADFESSPEDFDSDGESECRPAEPLVYHTCMTRDEWGHWMAHSTKIEKLKLPKVSVARVPVMVQKCHESPIRAYIEGRLDGPSRATTSPTVEHEKKQQEHRRSKKIIHSVRATSSPCPTMRDLLFDPVPNPEPLDFVPYNATLRPYSDIVEERLRIGKGQRKVQRQLRKSRMRWIEKLVDEICCRRRD
ncbi:uncharacterized protein LOC131285608 [Anopheles ziemanni]|uniref:uncharacterized protein LOC131267542 n=1 Tax=Anopheles coustani TaxID=139045 RepID=UPI00265AD6FD|nr:uncharacterized protein LOC131267542 [Anopheles coustani]XP_058170452.1 uncharacterized protein LOC131285608 [Anopheles ziemanni]